MVATSVGSVGVHEGHAFLVEAAVSLGGQNVKPGLNVFRFANRIPLLFEGGSDVISQTATNRINWASYKINPGSDRIGVFVSIVSTRIPFKGAGKEYIADDVEPIRNAVRSAIQVRRAMRCRAWGHVGPSVSLRVLTPRTCSAKMVRGHAFLPRSRAACSSSPRL